MSQSDHLSFINEMGTVSGMGTGSVPYPYVPSYMKVDTRLHIQAGYEMWHSRTALTCTRTKTK